MIKILAGIFSLFTCLTCFAQIEISQQVIGSMGGFDAIGPAYNISYTIGEAVVTTVEEDMLTLTQGFHQPVSAGPLRFEMDIANTTCPYLQDGIAVVRKIAGCTAPYKISWSLGSEESSVGNLAPGSYTVTVSSESCSKTLTFVIEEGPMENCSLKFYNAFSPNQDHVNNTWVIDNIELDEYWPNTVSIYNRWGEEVWRAENYDNKDVVWDGTSKYGTKLPDGTYFYIVHVMDNTYKGYIELTR